MEGVHWYVVGTKRGRVSFGHHLRDAIGGILQMMQAADIACGELSHRFDLRYRKLTSWWSVSVMLFAELELPHISLTFCF